MVLAFNPKIHLQDVLRRDPLTSNQANLVVDRNLDVFAAVISDKYERGEYRPYSRFGSSLPRVDVTSGARRRLELIKPHTRRSGQNDSARRGYGATAIAEISIFISRGSR